MNEQDYQRAVAEWYDSLYAFGYSLTGNRDDACELTQEAYSRLLAHGDRVRDPGRVKSWLFTTAYRIFLGWKERQTRLPHLDLVSVENELPPLQPEQVDRLEAEAVRDPLLSLEEHYRVALMLYYYGEHSYREIAEILDVPLGTVMSRLARGKSLLREKLAGQVRAVPGAADDPPARSSSGQVS